jgi:hypothetical protein
MCPLSRSPFIAVKLGAARRKWIGYVVSEAVTGIPVWDEFKQALNGILKENWG